MYVKMGMRKRKKIQISPILAKRRSIVYNNEEYKTFDTIYFISNVYVVAVITER